MLKAAWQYLERVALQTVPHCRDAYGTMSVSVMAYRCAKTLIHTTVCSRSDRVSSDILQRDQLCADVVSRNVRHAVSPTPLSMRDERHSQPKDNCRVSSYANDGVQAVRCFSLSDMGCACLAKACAKRLKRHPVGRVRVAEIDPSYRAVFQSTVCGVWLYDTTRA